jgi:hypothetical protein
VNRWPLGDLDDGDLWPGSLSRFDESDHLLRRCNTAIEVDRALAHLELQLPQAASVTAEGELLAFVTLVDDFVGTRRAEGLAALVVGQNVQGQHGSPHN